MSPQLSDFDGDVIDDPNAVVVELDDFVKVPGYDFLPNYAFGLDSGILVS